VPEAPPVATASPVAGGPPVPDEPPVEAPPAPPVVPPSGGGELGARSLVTAVAVELQAVERDNHDLAAALKVRGLRSATQGVSHRRVAAPSRVHNPGKRPVTAVAGGKRGPTTLARIRIRACGGIGSRETVVDAGAATNRGPRGPDEAQSRQV
jgi:hypothetical protein